jgi:hypothetical protein
LKASADLPWKFAAFAAAFTTSLSYAWLSPLLEITRAAPDLAARGAENVTFMKSPQALFETLVKQALSH